MNKSRLTVWCDGILEAAWLVALLAVPLFFNIHSDRVFEPDKLTLLRSLALLMSVLFIVRFIDIQGWKDLKWLRWKGENSIWRMPFILPVLIIVLVYLLSTIFSVTPRISWAGSYQRLQGTYTTLSYIVVFAVMIATIRTRAQIRRIVSTVIISSIGVSLYAMLQHFGLDPLPWGGDTQRRVAGHMGNSIFIGAYLIMAAPFTVVRILDAFSDILREEELSYADVIRSSVYIFALAIQVIALYWSQSRGPMIGLGVSVYALMLILLVSLRNSAVSQDNRSRWVDLVKALGLLLGGGVAAFGVLYLIINGVVGSGRAQSLAGSMTTFASFVGALAILVLSVFVLMAARKGWRWLWMSWIGLALLSAAWLVAFNFADEFVESAPASSSLMPVATEMAEWQELPAVGRFGQLLNAGSGSGRVRVLIWTGVVEMLGPHEPLEFPDGDEDSFSFLRPILGYGPESMYVAFNRFYEPELATWEARNATPDRAHNETFDALVITGYAGFLAWQLLYFTVFYFGFGWLGVVRSRRDKVMFAGLWIGMALVVSLLVTGWLGLVYVGVSIPLGSIIGLVMYLIYYALTAHPTEADEEKDPFKVSRLLVIGLVAAIVAHYVEIHLGIAIAATRLHFFVYLALLFLVGYLLPRREIMPAADATVAETEPPKRSRRRRGRRAPRTAWPSWLSPVLGVSLILGLLTGIMGWVFITYTTPAGVTIQTMADVPTAGEIIRQSLFQNAQDNFASSPYLFLMIVFTWALALLVLVSEMMKSGTLTLGRVRGALDTRRQQGGALLFVLLLVAALALRFLGGSSVAVDPLASLGQGLSLLWGLLCLLGLVALFVGGETGRFAAAAIALIGLLFAIPVAIAGAATYGLLLAVGCGVILYLLWDDAWNGILAPAGIMGLLSFSTGFLLIYFQAARLRASIIGPQNLPPDVDAVTRVIAQGDQRAAFVTFFYFFVFAIVLLGGLALSGRVQRNAPPISLPAAALAAVLAIPLVFAIYTSNLQVIQADIVYKWARPFDQQAAAARSQGNVELSLRAWDQAIGIYEHALDLAPQEDFYYLFLGRAYLEKAATTNDPAEEELLLRTAEERLTRAQEINPLNTDHTANLARLNTRWADIAQDGNRRARFQSAEDYYQDALNLSPNNAVIWNEYARLIYSRTGDCEEAIPIFQSSIQADPFYEVTYFNLGDVYINCGNSADDEAARNAYYRDAIAVLEEGFEVGSTRERRRAADPGILVQISQLYRELGEYEEALLTLDRARAYANNEIPEWSIDYQIATVYQEQGELDAARQLAEQVLSTAPPDVQPQVQQFLDQLNQSGGD